MSVNTAYGTAYRTLRIKHGTIF